MMSGGAEERAKELPAAVPERASYIDDAEKILKENAAPMHVSKLVEKIAAIRGTEVTRGSVESSLIRHGQAFKNKARIVRVARGTFGLPGMRTNGLAFDRHPDLIA